MSLATRLTALAQAVGADVKALNAKVNVATKTLDPWHTVGALGEPAFQNGWINNGDPYPGVQFRKDAFGKVQIRGSIKNGVAASTAFQLPVGYRPPKNEIYAIMTDGTLATPGTIIVDSVGNVLIYKGSINFVPLDVIEFDTDTVTELSMLIVGAAQAAVPMDAVHVVGAAGDPAFQNAWVNYDVNHPVRFRKDPLGKVRLFGLGKTGAIGTTMFTLPPGYWPPFERVYSVASNGAFGAVSIQADGRVQPIFGNSGYVALDPVEFDTELVTQMPTGPQGPKGDTGGVDILTTLDWNTALAPGFYRSSNTFLQHTNNSPGDPLNPPTTAGTVSAHANGSLTQRVWDLDFQVGYLRYRDSGGTWSPWVADLTRTPLFTSSVIGGATLNDGDERYFQTAAMKAAGLMWKFRYDKTSPLGNKWQFVGGGEHRFKATAAYTCVAANTWELVAAATFPRWTVPLTGVYRILYGARFQQVAVAAVEGYMGPGLTTASTPFDNIRFNAGQNAASVDIVHLASETEVALTEGQIVALWHNTQVTANSITYANQYMLIKPLQTA